MTAPRCWKCNDNRPCDLPHCGLKEDDAPTLPTDVLVGGHFIPRKKFDMFNAWLAENGKETYPQPPMSRAEYEQRQAQQAQKEDVPTLPAMSAEQIRAIAITAGCTEDDDGALVSALVIGAVAARDAQWAARLDDELHASYVKGQNEGAQYVAERNQREIAVLRAERDQARQMFDAACKHIADGAARQTTSILLDAIRARTKD